MKYALLPLLLFISTAVSCQDSDHNSLSKYLQSDEFTAYIDHRMSVEQIPSISIAAIEPDGQVHYQSFGDADPQTGREADEHTIYEIGSITKSITSAILHMLMQETNTMEDTGNPSPESSGTDTPGNRQDTSSLSSPGRRSSVHSSSGHRYPKHITPETPVNDLISGHAQIDPVDGTPMNLHHLLTHHGSLPQFPGNLQPENPADPFRDYSIEMMYEFLDQYTLPDAPGSRFVFSNTGYMLLGHIAEIISGDSMDELVRQYITGPAGMTATARIPVDSSLVAIPTSGGLSVPEWNFDGVKGFGELRSSAHDMAILAKIMSTGGTESNKIYDSDGMNADEGIKRISQAFQTAAASRVPLGDNRYIARGLFVHTLNDDEIVYHAGGTGGSSSFLGYSAESGKAVVVLSNSDRDIDDIGLHLLQSQYELNEVKEYLLLEREQLEKLEGLYVSDELPEFRIIRDGPWLYGQMSGYTPVPLNATSETEFENEAIRAEVHFELEDDMARSLTLTQGGQTYHFNRGFSSDVSREPEIIEIEAEKLDEYTGTYRTPSGMELTVTRAGNQLTARLTGQNTVPVYPVEADSDIFFYRVIDAELHFSREESGEVTSVTFHQEGRTFRFERTGAGG
ncbi:MAG: serine hydrolase [Balneolales bacterium]